MRGFGLNRCLAGTALALVLAIPGIAVAGGDKGTADPSVSAPASAPWQAPTESAAPAASVGAASSSSDADDTEAATADLPPFPHASDLDSTSTGSIEPATGSIDKSGIATGAPAVAAPVVAAPAVAAPAVAAPAVAPASSTASVDTSAPDQAPADAGTPAAAAPAPQSAPAATTPAAATAPAAPAANPAAATPLANAQPAIAAGLAPADAAVAEKLRDLISGKLDHIVERKKERMAVESFYTGRGFAPLWIENGTASVRAKAVIARLKAADLDGLDSHDYPTPDFAAIGSQPDALADADLKLTATVLTFARHASSGRFAATRITENVDVPQTGVDPAEVLTEVAASKDLAKTLDGFDPPQQGFQLLKAKLADFLHHDGAEDSKHIGDGPALRAGMHDPRVPALRERLGLEGDADDTAYDGKLAEAVKDFQRRMELRPTGVLDPRTVAILNGPPRGRQVDAIMATMERWRWMPRDLGKAYVMVNLPDFSLKMVDDGKVVFHTRIVIGKPDKSTPIFSNAIENIVMNPTWHVPESIVYKEYLPALEQDPTVLARMGLNVSHDRNGRLVITQPPSERNALGRMKFNFPNRFNVYLHDTPDKNLFGLERRAFSHGCMRVQNPTDFGAALLAVGLPDGHYTADHLHHMFGKGEEWLNFKTRIPVHITYQTAFVDEAGKLVVRDDVYGLDSRVLVAAKSPDVRVADASAATERHHDHAAPRHRLARETAPSAPDGIGSFFQHLFR